VSFIRVIEIKPKRADEVAALAGEWRSQPKAARPLRGAIKIVTTERHKKATTERKVPHGAKDRRLPRLPER
jgi:hypothetical protein